MSQIILIVLLVLLIIAPVIAAIIALIHAVIDSITKKRFPNIIAMLLLLFGIGFLLVWIYGDKLYTDTSKVVALCVLGMPWIQLRCVMLALAVVFAVAGVTWYVFLSFREDSVTRFRTRKLFRRKSKVKEGSADRSHERIAEGATEDTVETEEEIRESNRRTARLYRILTVCVAAVLSGTILAFLAFEWYLAHTVMTHDITEYTSPDGKYTIVVDNETMKLTSTTLYGSEVFLRIDPFRVRRLTEKNDRRKYLDITYEDITWEDQGIRIPYGNLELFYYYESVEPTD